jgi:hypothetical protein
MDLQTNLYLNPPYPEQVFAYKHQTVGLYWPLMPSGQGNFSEQNAAGPIAAFSLPPRDNPPFLRTNSQLDNYNPYGVSGVLFETTEDINAYNGAWTLEAINRYDDFGVSTGSINGIVSFLRPAYYPTIKTSLFSKSSGIVNAQAHSLALDAKESGITNPLASPKGMNYLSNAYYYVTTKSEFNFSPYLINNRTNYPLANQAASLSAGGLANNIRTISMTSGVITDVLTY